MQIHEINIYPITLPFLEKFSHSISEGFSAKNIVVEMITDHGKARGYGEGAPRSYVTGESQESAARSIKQIVEMDSFPRELNDISQIWDFVDRLPNGKEHNAAICALEMAFLDLLGRSKNESIIEYFPHDFLNDRIYYGVALPLAGKKRILELARLIKNMGIHQLKLKMGESLKKNLEIVETIHEVFGSECNIKIDVNGIWNRELAMEHVPLIIDHDIKIVEQPMMPGDKEIGEFAKEMQEDQVKVMADESACTLEETEKISKEGHYNMINVRLSKCGGYRRSFRIIRYLRENGIPFQIACQLGESGLLSAAGRILSLLCRDALFHDGSYDEFLLKENITVENITFGYGGSAGPLEGSGLGVEINRGNLKHLSNGKIHRIKVQ